MRWSRIEHINTVFDYITLLLTRYRNKIINAPNMFEKLFLLKVEFMFARK